MARTSPATSARWRAPTRLMSRRSRRRASASIRCRSTSTARKAGPGVAPGDYPSGGPLRAPVRREWREGAPSIDFLAPDIYFPNFAGIADGYAASDNPLFIPEANRPSDTRVASNALRSIGRLKAIGFSPFAIEDASEPEAATDRRALRDARQHRAAGACRAGRRADRRLRQPRQLRR